MSVEITSNSDGWIMAHVVGRFDYGCHVAFRPLSAKGVLCVGITIDLSRATYIDSAALGILLILRERVGNDPKRATISGATGQVLDVLTIAHFQRLFSFR